MSVTKPNRYEWQERFVVQCKDKFIGGVRDYLCVATPGGGKTIGALKEANALRKEGIIKRVVIVAPTRAVVQQWGAAAHDLDLEIERFGSPERRRAYDGIAVTYHAIAASPQSYRSYCNRSTLVILDEVHHADTQQMWGEALRLAFDAPTTYRLMLSGTPFRTVGLMPFIRYDPEKLKCGIYSAMIDFPYSHGDAVRDKVCRRILFPTIDVPHVEWARGDRKFAASLSDASLSEELKRERNAVVLDPTSTAVRLLLEQAHAKLVEVRGGRPDAGGLVIARNQQHALALADVLRSISGASPVCIISDDPEALDNIKRFRESADPWLVSVRMVSEGVDIKRLRVEAYLTGTDTPLFFRQAVGRITRRIDEQARVEDGYMYILNRQPLITYAAELEKEQEMVVEEDDDEKKPRKTGGNNGGDGFPAVLLSCEAERGDVILTGGAEAYTPEEILRAERAAARLGGEHTAEYLAEILRDIDVEDDADIKRPAEPKDARMERKCAQANSLAFALGIRRGYPRDEAAKRVHKEWALKPGNHWQNDMDEPELDRKIIWLRQEKARGQVA